MSSKADGVREDTRLRTLRLIAARPQITQRELAGELGISLGAAHYMLRALAKTGHIKLARFSQSKTKQGYAYVLTAQGLTEKALVAARFLERKRVEYEALRAEIEELTAELGQDRTAAQGYQARSKLPTH